MTFQYVAFTYNQRSAKSGAPSFCMFRARAGEILSWANINRLSKDQPGAIQRSPNRTRILGVKRFLQQDQRNTIPTAVIVAINGASVKGIELNPKGVHDQTLSLLTVKMNDDAKPEDRPGLIIDGQHRLKGIVEFDPDLYVNVIAILDADDNEKAFQFLVINNKAAKVSADHIRAMMNFDYENGELKERLRTARFNLGGGAGSVGVMDSEPDSPFRGMIKWPLNTTYSGDQVANPGFIPPAAIETAIAFIRSKGINDLEDADSIDEFFIAMWAKIKDVWPDIFNKDTKLLNKVGIVCLTEFLTDQLRARSLFKKTKFSMADPDAVSEHTSDLLESLDPSFWTSEWRSTSYDTRAGRDQIVDALDRIYANVSEGQPWDLDVDMVKAYVDGD
jgi:DGQHR domain-containing protein